VITTFKAYLYQFRILILLHCLDSGFVVGALDEPHDNTTPHVDDFLFLKTNKSLPEN
jgi:hypothetical protein